MGQWGSGAPREEGSRAGREEERERGGARERGEERRRGMTDKVRTIECLKFWIHFDKKFGQNAHIRPGPMQPNPSHRRGPGWVHAMSSRLVFQRCVCARDKVRGYR